MSEFKMIQMMVEVPKELPEDWSCSNCIHSNDSYDICVLRKCIHAIQSLKECYEPSNKTQDEVKNASNN